jgi:glutamyl-tRNA reductase
MNILVVGVNYKQTPVEIREKLSFNTSEQRVAMHEMLKLQDVCECILLSTCNRVEVYVCYENPDFDSSSIEKEICDLKGLELYNIKKYFYLYKSMKAVNHLFKVASGLDSMVLGEDEILRQVKDAYNVALEEGTSRSVLNTLFRDAITAAKKVKTFTQLSKNSVSVGTHAVLLAEKEFDMDLSDKSALVIGAGKIGTIALKNLISKGTHKIYATTRSHGRTENISKLYDNVELVDYANRYSVIDSCDIIISSTSSPHYTITKDLLENAITKKKQRVFIDLAVPRDIDRDIQEISWVRYFNIDHLQSEVDKNLDKRLLEATKAEEILNEYVVEYENWYYFRQVLPIVKDVQKFTNEVLDDGTNHLMSKLKCVSDEDKELVRQFIKSTVNEIVNKFVYSVRENSIKDE